MRMGALVWTSQAQLDGFKSRALRTAAPVTDNRHWHYEVEWSKLGLLRSESEALHVLIIGIASRELASQERAIQQRTVTGSDAAAANEQWHTVVFAAALHRDARARTSMLRVMDFALHVLHTAQHVALPLWICTALTQSRSFVSTPSHAGLWGLGRACRQEAMTMPVWCADVYDGCTRTTAMLIHRHMLQLSDGCVRGLQASSSVEPEAVCNRSAMLGVPRLVASYGDSPNDAGYIFSSLCCLLEAHASNVSAALDISRLTPAFALFEALCQQYLRQAVCAVPQSEVPIWHHKLLYAWCAKQGCPQCDLLVAPADVSATNDKLWSEVQLAERCGPRLADALSGKVAYQELLFPGGSMEAVLPVYEDAVGAAFYNGCVVAAVKAIHSLLSSRRTLGALEVGAGSGGTASSVLPAIEDACQRYVFTDVSDVFLRLARARFTEFTFLEYKLLNIDADPCLQGFAAHQYEIVISTNCLHATPFMRNTLRHCEQLLCEAGRLVVNEVCL